MADHAYLAAAIAKFARVVRPHDAGLSRRCAQAVRRALGWLAGRTPNPAEHLDVHSALALAKLELNALRPSRRMLADAEGHIEEVLGLQQPDGTFRASAGRRGLEMDEERRNRFGYACRFPFAYALSLVKYADACPDGRLRGRAVEALERFTAFGLRLIDRSPFGHLPEFTTDDHPRLVWPGSTGASCLSMALLLVATGRLTGEPSRFAAGERCIQWMFGANPRAMSFMVDEGYRNIGQYAGVHSGTRPEAMTYYNHNRDYRWGMSSGIRGSVGDYGPQPANYPNAGESMNGRYQHHGQEVWLLISGWFLLAGTELALALAPA